MCNVWYTSKNTVRKNTLHRYTWRPVVHVTVQRHQQIGNLRVLPTDQPTYQLIGVGAEMVPHLKMYIVVDNLYIAPKNFTMEKKIQTWSMFLLLLLLLDPVSVKATRVTCVVVRLLPDMSVGEPDHLSRNGFPAWLNEWTPQFHNPQAPSSPNSIKRWTSKANSVAQHYVHPFHVNSMKMHICTWSSPPLTWLGAPSASHPPKPFGSVRLNIYPFASPHVHCRKAETYISPHVQ